MVRLLSRVGQLRHVGVFPRFEVMRHWHENQSIPIDSFVHRRRPAHERLGLCLLRATAWRRHHPLGRPDQARRQRAVRRDQPADVRFTSPPPPPPPPPPLPLEGRGVRTQPSRLLQRGLQILDQIVGVFEAC